MDVIELNGNHYDARTGAFMGTASHAATAPAPQPAAPARHAAPAVRGTMQRHQPAHRPQHARTLMRHAVKKPQVAQPVTQPVTAAPAPAHTMIVGKAATLQPAVPARPVHQAAAAVISPEPQRLQRAQSVARSQHVSRFGNGVAVPIAPAAPVTPVHHAAPVVHHAAPAPAPVQAPTPVFAAVPATQVAHPSPKPISLDDIAPMQRKAPQPQMAQPAMAPKQSYQQLAQRRAGHAAGHIAAQTKAQTLAPPKAAKAPFHKAKPIPTRLDEDRHEQDIFEQALALATSHEQKPPKQSLLRAARRRKTMRRVFSIAASAAVFVSLAGFIAYQNKANIELQMASAKAGFPASAAGYTPAGYDMERVAYEAGTVATWYKSNDRTFSVIQKKSKWDSQTLLENHVATTSADYQGYAANGRTVYVYGKGRATWVNGGVWYQINAGDALSNEQLVKVAANM